MSSPTHKNLDSLIESNDSPSYVVAGGQVAQTRIYHAKFSVCLANILYEGAIGTGDQSGYVLTSCTVQHIGSEQGRLTYVWGAAGSGSGVTLPPDEVSVSGDNLSPRVESHKRYKPLDGVNVDWEGESVPLLAVVQNAVQATSSTTRAKAIAILTATPVSALALELVKKLEAGREAFYMAALRYSWTTHSFTIPTMYRGGWIEAPGGPLAGYFVADIDWLREADDLQYSAGIWRLTRSWLGGPNGHWDLQLYSVA